jgi:NADH-quinone oxidoreductase subunit M
MMGGWVLPAVLGLPLFGAILVMLLPRDEADLARGFGFAFSLATFALSLATLGYAQFDYGGFQLVLDQEWIPGLGAHFKVGVDGISLWLVLLTTFTTPIVILSAQKAVTEKVREFIAAILVLELGMLGAFVALDVFLFYVFWEIMLIPMYLIIGIWGGQRRIYASIKFVIYTMVGSLLMLVAIFYVYAKFGAQTGIYTTDLEQLLGVRLSVTEQVWCFGAFALAFAIKVPLFPLHTWLPDAHVEAPTAGSVVLAGVLLKFGIYGFLRYAMPLFPHGSQALAPYLAVLSVIGIIYGAFVAFTQEDVKKLVAYSSVSHLGFCMLGIVALTPMGITGSVFAMLSHGLTTGGLFLAIGMLYERRHTRRLSEYGGLWSQMPVFAGIFLVITLGSAGLPGLSGFVGEFLTIFGTFISESEGLIAPRLMAALAATGVIFGAVYLLYMFQRMMFGPITREANRKLKDLSGREIAVFTPIVIMIFVMGLYPRPFLRVTEMAVDRFMLTYQARLVSSLPEAAPPPAPGARVMPVGNEGGQR